MDTTLVIQSFGRENEYKRALFTILSFYAFTKQPIEQTQVLLFTDQPSYFESYLSGLPIKYVLLTPERIKEMRGRIDFLHRMKIAVIEEAFSRLRGNMLYADSDTFFIADPTPVVQKATETEAFMHVWEYHFYDIKDMPMPSGETFRAFHTLITTRKFVGANGENIKVTPQQSSWNAGVVIFHKSHERFIPDVYALTDQFYPGSRNHASEQYAFSILMQENTVLKACDEIIYHYWYKVKKQIVDQFLSKRMHQEWAHQSLDKKLDDVKAWAINMPAFFEKHIWTIKDSAIQAFNVNDFSRGYNWALKAIVKDPLDGNFIKDIFYHAKRHLKG